MSTHWGVVAADIAAGVGIVVAGGAAWLAQRSNAKSITVNARLAGIEEDRRRAERTPRLSARLESWGGGSSDLLLVVWLESAEPLARIRVVVQEARNMDGPIGFKRGQNGVPNDLPPVPALEGILPAWSSDSLHPLANWQDRMAPGTAAVWNMQLRQTAGMSGGCAAVRFKALAYADKDDATWELPLPVAFTDKARELIDAASTGPGR